MEFATNGDLALKISNHQQTNTLLPEATIWRIFVGLVQGLKQLHDLHIFHRDIKVTISKYRQQTSFCMRTMWQSLETWMSLRYLKRDSQWPKQEPLTTPVLRCGKISPMIKSQIFGHWVACFTSWFASKSLSRPKIWRVSTRRWLEGYMLAFRQITLKSSVLLLGLFCKWMQRCDLLVKKFSKCLQLKSGLISNKRRSRWKCSGQSRLRISMPWMSSCPRLIINLTSPGEAGLLRVWWTQLRKEINTLILSTKLKACQC